MGVTAFGTLMVNVFCALLLNTYKRKDNPLFLAAFLSARNDALINVSVMGTGLITFYTNSYVPDLLVGIFIAYINIDAVKKVWTAVK